MLKLFGSQSDAFLAFSSWFIIVIGSQSLKVREEIYDVRIGWCRGVCCRGMTGHRSLAWAELSGVLKCLVGDIDQCLGGKMRKKLI